MIDILTRILEPVRDSDMDDLRQYAQEALQDLILKSLSESGFSDVAVFHGGTCPASCTD